MSLAGEWVIVDSLHNSYVSAFDGTPRVRAWINELTITVTATSDSTYDFEAVTGGQMRFDTVSGQGFPPQPSGLGGLYGTIRVRGDTAHVTYLGKLDLAGAATDLIAFQRTLPVAECLDELGGLAQTSPPPVCRATHHWSREP